MTQIPTPDFAPGFMIYNRRLRFEKFMRDLFIILSGLGERVSERVGE